ncbi:MAG TPA: hypothetical protein VK157_11640 [Phycisphaerales bacterium]|nr:hypothetical protein [Phycisphaerales bacterium]
MRFTPALLITLAATSTSALAQTQSFLRFIATELESQPTPLPTVPPSTTDALLQSKLFVSPNGQYWASVFITLENGVTSRAVVSGTRTGIDFALARGQNIPGLNVAFESSASGLDTEVLVNDNGDISISGNLVPTTADEAIILYKRSDQTFSFIAREGSPIPGIAGESFGGGLDQRQLLPDGRVVFRDGSTTGALAAAVDEFIFVGGPNGAGFAPIIQGGVTTPTNQSAGGTAILTDVELGYGFFPQTNTWITRGILQRTAPNVVLVRNGAVVLEAGQPLPGAPTPTPDFSTAFSITDAGMGPGGDWWATGRSTSGGPVWLVANGQIVFTSDNDFPGGDPGERVSSLTSVNFTSRGDLQFAVFTNFARALVIVIPAGGAPVRVVDSAIEVDLNNNDDPSDDFFTAQTIFSSVLADDNTLYMIVRNNGIGDVVGYMPVSFGGPACDAVDFNQNGVFPEDQDVIDFFDVLAGGTCPTCNDIDFNNNGVFPEDQDVIDFFNVLAGGTCP